MFFFRFGREEMEQSLRVDTYTREDAMDERQKAYKRQCFVRLAVHLLLTDLCIAAVFLWDVYLMGFVGIYTAIRAMMELRACADMTTGRGLRTVYLFFSDRVRIMECGQMADIPYSEVTSSVLFEAGLVLRFKDGSGRVLSPKALEESECADDLNGLLQKKLGRRYRNKFKDPDYQAQLRERRQQDMDFRTQRLGRQLLGSGYEADDIDRRDYCRLVMKTGKAGKVFRVLIPVVGALATAAPFAALITGEHGFYGLCYLLVLVLLLLLLPMVIGLPGPAKGRFLTSGEETQEIFIHEEGIFVVAGVHHVLVRWQDMTEVLYEPELGMAFDLGKKGVVYLPADLTSEEVFRWILEKATSQRRPSHGGEEEQRFGK